MIVSSCRRILFRGNARVRVDRRFHFRIGQIVLFAQGLGINVVCRNAVLNQEVLGPVNTTLRERLIVLNAATTVRMPFEDQMSIRLRQQIFLEVSSQFSESLLLAW